jgi:riboflavin synthase
MFTGIIESIGKVVDVIPSGSNRDLIIESDISDQLKIDQSVSHNGVCLTVVEVRNRTHRVTAINETLQRTNLNYCHPESRINLERAMLAGSRLDGHLVLGHVDQTATIVDIESQNGSWLFTFRYVPSKEVLLVYKGSVCIDGVSLTVSNLQHNLFSVAIIPYTFEHTIFQYYKKGDIVNIEFDIIGKYIAKHFEHYALHFKP